MKHDKQKPGVDCTDDETLSSSGKERRRAMKFLGYAIGMAAVGSTLPSYAADRTLRPMTAQPMLPAVQLKGHEPLAKISIQQLRELHVIRNMNGMPLGTPITRLGGKSGMLTPAAAKLTKGDLINLGRGQKGGRLSKLTLQDIKSIQAAFGGGVNPAAIDVSCCCCTPCCCAAAMPTPTAKVA